MKKKMFFLITILSLLFSLWFFSEKPSHNRNWENGQEKLPRLSITENILTIENFRDFNWYTEDLAHTEYRTETFNLENMVGLDLIISHFDNFEGLAHIFLSFRFSDGKNIVVSVESRRELGEKFSPFWGLLRKFELIYIVGSEKDLIGVRTDLRKERVYLYPTIATPQKTHELLRLLAKDINIIHEKPVFYNTLLNNCTNTITKRVEDISEINFPLTYKSILPGFMDEVLYDLKIIPHDKTFLEIKNKYFIDNTKVEKNNPNYPFQIRNWITN